MSIFTKLSNNPATGEATINDQPASKQAVCDLLHKKGTWQNGDYITVDLDGFEFGLQPANQAARDVVTGMRNRRG